MTDTSATLADTHNAAVTTGRRSTMWPALLRLSWRNLWRNRRRTWLTVSGIAFAVFLLVFARSLQDGTFIGMVDNIANMLVGHGQIQHPMYEDDPRMEHLIYEVAELTELAAGTAGVAYASARGESFALVSHGERSFGAQIIGVQPKVEQHWNTLALQPATGRYLANTGEAYLGVSLARNLGVQPGDELVLLATAYRGGVAAAALTLVGTFDSASSELNRALVMVDLATFREAWGVQDNAAHSIILQASSVAEAEQATHQIASQLGTMPQTSSSAANNTNQLRVRGWRSLMPEAVQTMDIKSLSTDLFFYLIAVIVTFSIVNTFMMTMFERTPEFGMLMSLGMRPGRLLFMLQAEALWVGLLGVGLGALLAWALVVATAVNGIPVPQAAAEVAQGMNIPTRFVPVFNYESLQFAVLCMLLATQAAALWPGIKLLSLQPMEALRERSS